MLANEVNGKIFLGLNDRLLEGMMRWRGPFVWMEVKELVRVVER